jgi:hypothetical protein
MNFTFLNPGAFWGLLALTFPLAIHLLSKSKGTTIWVGNISWIKQIEKTRSRSIRLNEYALLALRSLIISMLIIIQAGPVIQKNQNTPRRNLLLIDSEVAELNIVKSKIDTVDLNNFDIRYLHNNKIVNEIEDTVYLQNNLFLSLEELEAKNLYQEVIFFSDGLVKNVSGVFPKFSFDLTWYQLPSSPGEFTILQKRFSKDSVLVIDQYLAGNNLISNRKIVHVSSIEPVELPEPKIKSAIIVAETGSEKEVQDWIRVLDAIAKQSEFNFEMKGVYTPENFPADSLMNTYVVWIGDEQIPVINSLGIIKYDHLKANTISGTVSISKLQNTLYEIHGRITTETIYNEDFLKKIFFLFFGNEISPEILRNSDYRQFTQKMERQNIVAGTFSEERDFTYPFWLALFCLIIGERALSVKRGQ